MNKKLNQTIQWSMSFTTLMTYLVFILAGRILADIMNLNDISGWQMQIRNSGIDGIFEISLIIFLITYLILDIKKQYRNILISKFHLVSISICAIINSFGNIDIKIYLSFVVYAIFLFLINVYLTVKNVAQHRV
ncbi:hypothetical protein [Winogradskyella psychrotolerans]|uniref:hypothetical protein n=1 Tax=Winogradskyella psychrotolerans TaxID=1344585 RepID=UPI001C06B5BD|nr:hypothetical protein [Winogradskyella psychrotolerans]MBU2929755.1 hypothetical protein [Winogradskyella psychrotolerans]